jgi:hypothetical protein
MKKALKRLAAIILVLVIALGSFGFSIAPESGQALMSGGGAANHEFIKPVTHQTAAPEGCIGIYTASDLNNVRNNPASDYIMMNDIDLAGWGNWAPIGEAAAPFSGVFNGNGYVIKNMTIDIVSNDNIYVGFLGHTLNSAVFNLGIINAEIIAEVVSSKSIYAGIISAMSYSSVFSNCFSGGTLYTEISSQGFYTNDAGGLLGFGDSVSLINCFNMADVTVISSNNAVCAGGINGMMRHSEIRRCYNTGKISALSSNYTYAGGIAGCAAESHESDIKDCYNLGGIVADSQKFVYVGGLIGLSSTIKNSYNIGSISIISQDPSCVFAGGIAGKTVFHRITVHKNVKTDFDAYLTNCYYLGNILKAVSNPESGAIKNVKSLSNEQIGQMSSYNGFDFENIWTILSCDSSPVFNRDISRLNISAKIRYKGAASLFSSGQSEVIYWRSSNNSVAVINDDGCVYGACVGTATINFITSDGQIGESEVYVNYTWWQWVIKIVLFGWVWY